jgi:hypothetical protein
VTCPELFRRLRILSGCPNHEVNPLAEQKDIAQENENGSLWLKKAKRTPPKVHVAPERELFEISPPKIVKKRAASKVF